jgi:hypothetical protein
MDPLEPFLTEEFFRYSAECRRLARLARKPHGAKQGNTAGYRTWIDWVRDIRATDIINPLTHRPQLLASRASRRR